MIYDLHSKQKTETFCWSEYFLKARIIFLFLRSTQLTETLAALVGNNR